MGDIGGTMNALLSSVDIPFEEKKVHKCHQKMT